MGGLGGIAFVRRLEIDQPQGAPVSAEFDPVDLAFDENAMEEDPLSAVQVPFLFQEGEVIFFCEEFSCRVVDPAEEHFFLDPDRRGQGAAAFFCQFPAEVCTEGIDRILFRAAGVDIKVFQRGMADSPEGEIIQFSGFVIVFCHTHGV